MQFDHLLVSELRAVVYEGEAVVRVAVTALGRFGDAAAVNLHGGGQRAHHALEERLSHLWHDVAGARHHAAHADQLVYVCNGRSTC